MNTTVIPPPKIIADEIIKIVQEDVDTKLSETHGPNRSPRIDSFNDRTGVLLGSSYCMSGLWCAIDDACKKMGLTNPVPPTAWSLGFFRTAPRNYKKPFINTGKYPQISPGSVCVWGRRGDPNHGHVGLLKRYLVGARNSLNTLEYNTNKAGSPEGEGAHEKWRDIFSEGSLILLGFVDVPTWIFQTAVKNFNLRYSSK